MQYLKNYLLIIYFFFMKKKGSGKTVLFELAIVQALILGDGPNKLLNKKAIYIAPIKALCSQKY